MRPSLTAKRAETLIRKLAERSQNVVFSHHAMLRMEQRTISLMDVFNVLTKGFVEATPKPAKSHGEWVCKVVRHARGNRDIGVITILIREERLFIKTVEWEDL